MNNPSHWARLKVQEFFQGYNWSGRITPLEPSPVLSASNAPLSSSLRSTVGDFFAQISWKGEALPPVVPVVTQVQVSAPSQSLTSKVGDYFRTFPWRGGLFSQAIESPVAVSTPPTPFPTQDNLDLADLSGLF
jgi:hypothetical protein